METYCDLFKFKIGVNKIFQIYHVGKQLFKNLFSMKTWVSFCFKLHLKKNLSTEIKQISPF